MKLHALSDNMLFFILLQGKEKERARGKERGKVQLGKERGKVRWHISLSCGDLFCGVSHASFCFA